MCICEFKCVFLNMCVCEFVYVCVNVYVCVCVWMFTGVKSDAVTSDIPWF